MGFGDGRGLSKSQADAFYGPLGSVAPSIQCQKLIETLRMGQRDTAILVVGDSTGNADDEWVRLFTNYLAPLYPAYTVNYYLYDTGTGDFPASPVVVQTGSGSFKLNVYNASVAGTIPQYFLGSHFGAIRDIAVAPDLLIVNHGKNMTAQYSNAFSTPWRYLSQATEFTETIWQVWPNAGFIWVAQAPNRDDNNMAIAMDMIQSVARLRGIGVANVYDLYINAGKPSAWYVDNLHPSDAGTQVYLQPWIAAVSNVTGVQPAQFVSSLDQHAPNFLVNGDLATLNSGTPYGWTASNVTCTLSSTQYDNISGVSLRTTQTAAGSNSYIKQRFTGTAALKPFRGHWCTLAVRRYIPNTNAGTAAGRIGLLTSSNNANNSPNYTTAQDGWVWRIMNVYVAPSDTYLDVFLYNDTGTAANTDFIYWDRAILTVGLLPRDIAPRSTSAFSLSGVNAFGFQNFSGAGTISAWAGAQIAYTATGAVSLALPTGPTQGMTFYIYDEGGGALVGNISLTSSDKAINATAAGGGAVTAVTTNYGRAVVYYNGTKWVLTK
jgi:hypothetical protein